MAAGGIGQRQFIQRVFNHLPCGAVPIPGPQHQAAQSNNREDSIIHESTSQGHIPAEGVGSSEIPLQVEAQLVLESVDDDLVFNQRVCVVKYRMHFTMNDS